MLESIVKRRSRIHPLSETEIKIIRSAAKLFLEKGYSSTTFRMIEADSGVRVGNITYYFRNKEDLLNILTEELMDYHATVLDEVHEKTGDKLLAYALEITVQITLCEINPTARDLYYCGYDLPLTYENIKSWSAEKNCAMFSEFLPEWTERDFRDVEIIASGIEFAAMKSSCDRHLSIDRKISIVLDSLLMLYKVPEDKRKEIIGRVLEFDYETISRDMFDSFVRRLDNDLVNK